MYIVHMYNMQWNLFFFLNKVLYIIILITCTNQEMLYNIEI